jgi:kanamycin kinase
VKLAAMDEPALPGGLQKRYGGYEWEPVTFGRTGARVWRLVGPGDLFVKIIRSDHCPVPRISVAREAEALTWLAGQGIGAPEVVEAGVTEDGWEFLVSTALPGRPADQPWPKHDRPLLVDALVRFADHLHSLPAESCPLDMSLSAVVPLANAQIERWKAIPGWTSEYRPGWSAAELEAAWAKALAEAPVEELAVCHADFTLPNLLIDPATMEVSGVIDLGGLGVADRYSDLVAMMWSLNDTELNPQFGTEYARRFLHEATGGSIDLPKFAFYEFLFVLV